MCLCGSSFSHYLELFVVLGVH